MFLEPVFFCTNPVRQSGPDFQPVIPGVWLPLPNALMPLRCLYPLRPSKTLISESGGGVLITTLPQSWFQFQTGYKKRHFDTYYRGVIWSF